jgi:prepilin-type processing-associated H-X9-DG protein
MTRITLIRRGSERGGARTARGIATGELIAVGTMVLVAGAVFAPAVQNARSRAREASCLTKLGGFGAGMLMYANDNFDYIPGVNTSGVPLRVKQLTMVSDPNVLHSPTLPVQTTDWMTPVVQNLTPDPLPSNRAARWHYLWTAYGCPQQSATAIPWVSASSPVPDAADFAQYDWPASSYLASFWFQLWGQSNRPILAYYEYPNPNIRSPIYASAAPTQWEVIVQTYRPRLDEMTNPWSKVFVADGTRHISGQSQPIDFEINPVPVAALSFGAFASGGAWYGGDNAYGVRTGTLNWSLDPVPFGSISGGYNLPLSYRHEPEFPTADYISNDDGAAAANLGAINAVFFDGHVENQVDRKSRTISQWYPTGGVVQDAVNMTTVPVGSVIP